MNEEPRVAVATGAGEDLRIIYSRPASERLLPSLREWRASPKTRERHLWPGNLRIAEYASPNALAGAAAL